MRKWNVGNWAIAIALMVLMAAAFDTAMRSVRTAAASSAAGVEMPPTPLADHGFSHRDWMETVKKTTGIPWSWSEVLCGDSEVAALWDRMEAAAADDGVQSYADAAAWLDRHTAEYAELTMYRASARYELKLTAKAAAEASASAE